MSILITGANRGIGHALYERYTEQNRAVLGTSRQGDAPFLPLDVTDPNSQNALAETLTDQPVDLLVCNAGVYLDKANNLETGFPADMWAQTFATNVTGVFLSVQALLRNLRLAKSAKIAIISSQMASQARASGGSYIYRASKAASLNLGRNLSCDLRSEGIAVGIYHPGWVITDMGGEHADISTSDAASGLVKRFDELSIENTGCFLNWDGSAQEY